MGSIRSKQSPIRLGKGGKRDLRTQFAVLPYRRRKNEIQVLLLTSLDTKRWVLPKGWPMDGMTPSAAAAQEAWEEAGLKGVVGENAVGFYPYTKSFDRGLPLPIMVAVFPMAVEKMVDKFPEAGLRKRKWFSLRKAAARVDEPDLKRLLRHFSPSRAF